MTGHHRRRDKHRDDDSDETSRHHRHRKRDRRRRDRDRGKSADQYDEESDGRRRRRGRGRQGTTESSHRDHDRERQKRHRRQRDVQRDRDRSNRHDTNRDQAYLTPRLEDTSYALDAYSPFGSPPAAPPAYEDRRPRRVTDNVYEKGHIGDKEFGKEVDAAAAADRADGDGDAEKQGNTEPKGITKLERWGGPFAYIISILTAITLLFAATCSADTWRVKVNVVRVDLPNDAFTRLLATAKNLGKSGPGDAADRKGGVAERGTAKLVAAGYVCVGFWGWCVSRPDQSEYACSPTNAWYTMEDLLETAEITNAIPARAFHDGLIHGLVVYGPAMVAAMAAAVPTGIHIWRRLFRNNRNVEAGLALHASLFCGGTFAFIASMVSKALAWRLSKKQKFPVATGSVPTMAGIASLLLFLALASSMIPVIYRRVKRQQDILGSWDDVQAAQPTPPPTTSFGRSFSLKRKKTWRRMTGYFGSPKREGRRRRRHR